MADAELFSASEGFEMEINPQDPTQVLINFRDSTGNVTATPFRIKRDTQGFYSFDRPGISDGAHFRIDSNGKISEQ